jgi:hypothetical protein
MILDYRSILHWIALHVVLNRHGQGRGGAGEGALCVCARVRACACVHARALVYLV